MIQSKAPRASSGPSNGRPARGPRARGVPIVEISEDEDEDEQAKRRARKPKVVRS
jgi:hypothetical protein